MFDYFVPGASPAQDTIVWSQLPIQPFAHQALTPFSFSVLSELSSRAWFQYYDELGFEPTPRTRILRRHRGHAYWNLTTSARLDTEVAGIEPYTLRLNGEPFSLCGSPRGGLLSSFTLGRKAKKIDKLLETLTQEMETTTRKAANWHLKTQELRWSQAEVLQVMEEIERVGTRPMMTYIAARHNLEQLYNRLLLATVDRVPFPKNVLLINNALCDLDGLVEFDIAAAVVGLKEKSLEQGQEQIVAWLRAGDFTNWQETLPGRALRNEVEAFFSRFEHRGKGEGETRQPRWKENPMPVFRSLLACIECDAALPVKIPSANTTQKLLAAAEPKQHKNVQQILEKVRDLHRLQSQSLHTLAYIWAGTRRWALAAAEEAMVDNRLSQSDDVFFFELEEIKQMMTGEWNVSSQAEIRATLAERKEQYETWLQERPGEILIGDTEGKSVHTGLPGVVGHAIGPLRRRRSQDQEPNAYKNGILGAPVLDSGWSLALPVAEGFVAAGGSPVDAFVAAARAWHRPTLINLREQYHALTESAQTTVDGDNMTVDQ